MSDDHDITFAATAFAAALPSVEYRPGDGRAPRRHRRGPAAIAASVATVAVVAVTTTALISSGGQAPNAWSATPKHLSDDTTEQIDQQCRAAKPADDAAVNAGPKDAGPHTSGEPGGPIVEHTLERGSVQRSDGPSAATSGPLIPPKSAAIGNLPLILVDSRGEMTLALYGNANHHIICTIDPDGRVMLTPDGETWESGKLINAAAALGNVVTKGDGSVSSAIKLLGTIAANVTKVTVDVPEVGPVDATVANGHYALFVPQQLLGGSNGTSPQDTKLAPMTWPVKVTTSDGVVHDTTLVGGIAVEKPAP